MVGKHQDLLLFPPASSSSFSCSLISRYMNTPCQLLELCDLTPLLKVNAKINQTLNFENLWVCKAYTNEHTTERLRCTCSYNERQSPSNYVLKLCSKRKLITLFFSICNFNSFGKFGALKINISLRFH